MKRSTFISRRDSLSTSYKEKHNRFAERYNLLVDGHLDKQQIEILDHLLEQDTDPLSEDNTINDDRYRSSKIN